jgi:uncharacterized protein YhbP (UPF0306 family)
MELTKQHVLEFIRTQKQMVVATFGAEPWIATVYYTFDNDLNLYFLSDPATLHCKHIEQNNTVAVAIADSDQDIAAKKRGLQLIGEAKQISSAEKIRHALGMWKEFLNVEDPELSYESMAKKTITGRMYKITPKRIKLFDQELFDVEDGQEPILEL